MRFVRGDDVDIEVPGCILCGERHATTVEKCEPPFQVIKCRGCGLIFVNPQPEVPEEHYTEEYFAHWRDCEEVPRRKMWKRRLDFVKQYAHCGRLLDVGCGLGTFLTQARLAGFETAGTEVSPYCGDYVREQQGQKIHIGQLTDLDMPPGSFDVITFWHTLEHMRDPLRELKRAWHLLAEGGVAIIAVPNADNRIMQAAYPLVRGRRLRLFSIHAKELHLFHFTLTTLRKLAESAGLSVVQAGADYGQVTPAKKLLDRAAWLTRKCTRRWWGEAILLVARKVRPL